MALEPVSTDVEGGEVIAFPAERVGSCERCVYSRVGVDEDDEYDVQLYCELVRDPIHDERWAMRCEAYRPERKP